MLSLTHHLPIDYAGGSSKPQVISGTLSQRPSAAFFGKSTSTAANHNRIDHNTIPLLTNGWNRTSSCNRGFTILFCHGSSLHQWWSPPQSPPTTNLTAAFSFFFSTKKTATVGQIVRSGPYQCCSVHVNLQEGGSGNSKTRKKAETFHNSRSH